MKEITKDLRSILKNEIFRIMRKELKLFYKVMSVEILFWFLLFLSFISFI